MVGIEEINTVLNHLVESPSSQLTNTILTTYIYAPYFFVNMINALSFVPGEAYFTHATYDTDHGAPSSQRITMTASPRG
jgi:hypothetical protein